MSEPLYLKFWGKTGASDGSDLPACHLLPYHSLDVAAAAEAVLERDALLRTRLAEKLHLGREKVTGWLRALIALHDLGKFSERFQSLDTAVARSLGGPTTRQSYTIRHDTLGYGAWTSIVYPALWDEAWLDLQSLHADRWDWGDYFEALMKPVTGHHGHPPDVTKVQAAQSQFSTPSTKAARAFSRDALALLLPSVPFTSWDYGHVPMARQASWMIAGLTILADWIASDRHQIRYQRQPMPLSEYWHKHARPQAREAVTRAGISAPAPSADTGLKALFPAYDPTPMQRYASTVDLGDGPQLFILEDVTGSGKTEAATVLGHRLMAADRGRGVYVGLPTMATANSMYTRMARAYYRLFAQPERASVVLAHSARDLSEPFQRSIGLEIAGGEAQTTYGSESDDRTAEAQCTAWLADHRKKALLAHIGVGTIDQALLGVLPSEHQSLRLLGLSRNVLIVDEVHAYDAYMQRLLKQLLRFQAAQGGSAILLSATLPQSMRQDLADAFRSGLGAPEAPLTATGFPLATRVGQTVHETAVNEDCRDGAQIRAGYRRNVRVHLSHSEEAVLDTLVETARQGRCACWVRNTVADAREGWRKLQERFRDDPALDPGRAHLFHARYAMADRQSIEDDVLSWFGKDSDPPSRTGRVLVATQVVEQSLDLDFDTMASDLAPIDLLIQRAGRMHRHRRTSEGHRTDDGPDERGEPTLTVLCPSMSGTPSENWYASLFPRGAYVYPDVEGLWLTARTLQKKGRIRVPGEARDLIEHVYGDEAVEEVPPALRDATRKVEEERRINRSVAAGNVLHLHEGYGAPGDTNRWRREQSAPTRLGDPTTTVRLGRRINNQIMPWAGEGDHAWRRSEVRVRATSVAKEARHGAEQRQPVADAKETMPDEGRWSVLVVLEPDEGAWHGAARNAEGEPVQMFYSPTSGLQVDKPQ
jgi:CRISPR-associated endonuclease/helicase Cas3